MSNIKIPLLTSEDIEVKVKQVTANGALGLLYKTARVDRRILNEVFGPMNWTSDFKMIDDVLFCGIGIRESMDQDFVWKWDAGGESENALDDGAKAKANASDALKRAGFAVGIGEELYTSPTIWLEVQTVKDDRGKWKLADPFAKYVVTCIEYNEKTRVITKLQIANAKSNIVVFNWEMPTSGAIGQKMVKTLGDTNTASATETPKNEPVVPQEAKKTPKASKVTPAVKVPLKDLISNIGQMVKGMYATEGSADSYNTIVATVTGGNTFKCNAATEDDYDTVLEIHDKLVEGGYGV